MSKETERVLEMVADGTVTAAEGAKLLEALGSANRAPDMGRMHRKKRIIDTRAMIHEIGPMIQSTIGDVFGGRKPHESFKEFDLQEVEAIEEELEDGISLVIHGNIEGSKSISIALLRSQDNFLRATAEDNSSLETGSKDQKKVVVCNSGDLTVEIPDNVKDVKVFSKGGGISSKEVRVPLSLKTMGGGVSVEKPANSFSVKTMGGGLEITLDKEWTQNSKAKTMGGGIAVHLTEGMSVKVNASTFGGSISFDKDKAEVLSESEHNFGKAKVSLQYGEGDVLPVLAVTSMGGGIEINQTDDDEAVDE